MFHGQVIFAVVARTRDAARRAARLAEDRDRDAEARRHRGGCIAAGTKDVGEPYAFNRRDLKKAHLASSASIIEESFRIGGQEHFYLEGQVSLAVPEEHGAVTVHCSTQHPSEVQHLVPDMLDIRMPPHGRRLRRQGKPGGAMGLPRGTCSRVTGHPAKCRLDRDDDMIMTGKRHDFRVDYRVGFDARRAASGVSTSISCRAAATRRISEQRHLRPHDVPCGQRLLLSRSPHRHAQAEDHIRVEHRLPRLRRAAGHGLGRAHDRHRASAPGSTRSTCAPISTADGKRGNVTPYGMKVEDNIIGRHGELESRPTTARGRKEIAPSTPRARS
jgi:xanthine dehydrogenase large subunit